MGTRSSFKYLSVSTKWNSILVLFGCGREGGAEGASHEHFQTTHQIASDGRASSAIDPKAPSACAAITEVAVDKNKRLRPGTDGRPQSGEGAHTTRPAERGSSPSGWTDTKSAPWVPRELFPSSFGRPRKSSDAVGKPSKLRRQAR